MARSVEQNLCGAGGGCGDRAEGPLWQSDRGAVNCLIGPVGSDVDEVRCRLGVRHAFWPGVRWR